MAVSVKTAVVSVGLLLASCAPSQEAIEAASFSVAETATPVAHFSNFCLKNLPDFKGAYTYATASGWKLVTEEDGKRIYRANEGKPTTLFYGIEDGDVACGIAFLGSTDTDAVGTQLLTEATKRTGGTPREKLDSSFFAYAYYLRNRSVFTHDIRRKNGQTRHIFLISPPIPKDKIADYIYN